MIPTVSDRINSYPLGLTTSLRDVSKVANKRSSEYTFYLLFDLKTQSFYS